MKNKVTKNKSDKSFEFGQVMTMLEQMNDGIGVIAEAQQETNNRLGGLEGRFDGLEKKVDVIDRGLINVENRLIKVEGNVTEINERLIRVEDDVTVMNERMIRVEDDVIEIKHKLSEKVDRDEFNKMEKRMVKLEKLVFAKLG